VTYLEGRCLSYGSAMPYHPMIDVVRHNCGITDTDDAALISEKVRFGLQEVGMDPEDAAPYLLQLVGVKEGMERLTALSPEAIKTRTFATLRQMSLNGSRQRTLIFEVEDLHWIDKTSEEYLASLVESLAGTAILLLCTYRPGHRPPWLEKSYATQLALHPLPPQDSRTVVTSTLQRARIPETLTQLILAKAEGNPFFLEELTQAVLERADVLADVAVPDTIQGVLMARIDRLPEDAKRLLQTAAVLGRELYLAAPQQALGGARRPGAAASSAQAAGVSLRAERCRGTRIRLQARSDAGGGLREPYHGSATGPACGGWAGPGSALCRSSGGSV
jgi:predicted ATPase